MMEVFLGGARSGKSTAATSRAVSVGAPVSLIATGHATDAEMTARIERHQIDRPKDWVTIEEPIDVVGATARVSPDATIILDCVGFWIANLMDRTDAEVLSMVAACADSFASRNSLVCVVTNEVGSGVVPVSESGRRFRDLLGFANQTFVAASDAAYLTVAGRLLPLIEPGQL